MMVDPISDMITRVKNAAMAGHEKVEFPASRIKASICKVLKDEGFIKSFKIIAKSDNDIMLRVAFKEGALTDIKRISKPGLRKYSSYQEIPRVLSGLGITILSTSKGVISSREAKNAKVGGELICRVW